MRRPLSDPRWWQTFIARRKASRVGWWSDWWTLVDEKIRWPDG